MMQNMANFIVRNKNTCVLKIVPMFGLWTFFIFLNRMCMFSLKFVCLDFGLSF